MFDERADSLRQARSTKSNVEVSLSPVQTVFPEFALKGDRVLPTDLHRDHFTFSKSTDAILTTAERALNWLTGGGENPLVISGPSGIGKSVLGWQIMNEADNRGLVPIMVSAADIVTGKSLDQPNGFGRALPFTSIEKFESVLSNLEYYKSLGSDFGKSIVVIIDGIDPDSYHAESRPGGTRLLKAIQSHGMQVILNVDSDKNLVEGGSIDAYHRKLNPEGYATGALILGRDSNGKKIVDKHDLSFKKP
jgi:hypothetical protein